MKILVVHNFYQSHSPSGEDTVFKNEVDLLRGRGINVITYTRHNNEIVSFLDKIKSSFTSIWSEKTYKDIKVIIRRERPDIVHFHNIWYLISPSAYFACKEENIPVIQTLHNFRICCTNGLLFRNSKICEECIPSKNDCLNLLFNPRLKLIVNGLKYYCYRKSRLYTLPVAVNQFWHWMKRTWIDKIDAYISLTKFAKGKFVEMGIPEKKIYVKPNFLINPPEPRYINSNYAVFIGRLTEEKGIRFLIETIKILIRNKELHNDPNKFYFKIVGDGPLRSQIENDVKKENISIVEFTGRKSSDDVIKILKDAKFMIMPSICYETFGLTIIEAFACGKPVVASNHGAMAEIVENGRTGLLFNVGRQGDLARKIKWMIFNESACVKMGKNARVEFEEKYRPEKNYEIFMNIVNKIIV